MTCRIRHGHLGPQGNGPIRGPYLLNPSSRHAPEVNFWKSITQPWNRRQLIESAGIIPGSPGAQSISTMCWTRPTRENGLMRFGLRWQSYKAGTDGRRRCEETKQSTLELPPIPSNLCGGEKKGLLQHHSAYDERFDAQVTNQIQVLMVGLPPLQQRNQWVKWCEGQSSTLFYQVDRAVKQISQERAGNCS